MTQKDKKKKAAMIAVAYYLEQEKLAQRKNKRTNLWGNMGVELNMENRLRVQRRNKLN